MTLKCSSHKLRSPVVWGVVLDISRQCGALIFKHQSLQKVRNLRHESLTDIAPHSRGKETTALMQKTKHSNKLFQGTILVFTQEITKCMLTSTLVATKF
jgi:hypothetical protein